MLFLWIFGDNVEDAMGHGRYLVFYFVGGVCAAAAQTLVDPMSLIPMLGASGAIAAVLAAYVLLYPRSPVTVLNPISLLWLFFGLFLRFPAWLVIGRVLRRQPLVRACDQLAQGGVAFMAHVGGFLGGAFLYRPFLAGRARLTTTRAGERVGAPARPATSAGAGDAHSPRRSMRPLSTATSALLATARTPSSIIA